MRIDSSHRPWALASAAVFAVALGVYVPYALIASPKGSGVIGIIYGIAGYALMLFAGLLGARKKVPIWRIGRAQHWMRGHIWLGLLTFPLILFHSGFSFGGHLTTVLMILLIFTWLSGITGALIQHFLPSFMTDAVPLETIYEEIPRVREQLRDEADHLVRVVVSQPEPELVAAGGPEAGSTNEPVEMIEMETGEREYLGSVYHGMVLPFLRDPQQPSLLAHANRAEAFFEALRRRVPSAAHGVIANLESICEEERQLSRQSRIYLWLHGWLMVNVPLSITLLVLGAIHAIVALRYYGMPEYSGRIRTTKKLAQRIDRTYFKRLFPIPLWRRILTVALIAVGVGWLGISALGHNQSPYSSGPLSHSHAFLGKNCATCHGQGIGLAKKVNMQACASCHDAPVHSALEVRTPTCTECHVEHRGELRLVSGNDRTCVDCHSNLQTKKGAPTVAANISSFTSGHPEFAAVRKPSAGPGIKFNHQIHVAGASMPCGGCHTPEGVGQPPGTGMHEGSRARAYMQRVTYQDQCAGCHALNFDDLITDATAPHDKPEVVHAFVEQKLTSFIAAHPGELGKKGAPGSPAAWVKFRTSEDEKQLWGATCARCHEMGAADASGFPTVPPTKANARQFTGAVFDHGAHQELQCASCHTGAAASTSASDQLLPGIAVCKTCHNSEARTAGDSCTTCHVYHDWSKGKAVDGKFTIDHLISKL